MTPSTVWKPNDTTISNNKPALRASLPSKAEPCPRGRRLQAVSNADDKFLIFNPTLAYTTTPEPPVSDEASQTVQISKQQQQNASAEVDINSFAEELERVSISSVQSKTRKGAVGPETLARRWCIGIERARKTLEPTTQLGARDFSDLTGSRQLNSIHHQLKYRCLDIEVCVDAMERRIISLLGNKYATIYCTHYHWISVDPIPTKGETLDWKGEPTITSIGEHAM